MIFRMKAVVLLRRAHFPLYPPSTPVDIRSGSENSRASQPLSGQRKGAVELITEALTCPHALPRQYRALPLRKSAASTGKCGMEGFLTMLIASSAGPKHMGGKIHG
jgi:hypothetical protein